MKKGYLTEGKQNGMINFDEGKRVVNKKKWHNRKAEGRKNGMIVDRKKSKEWNKGKSKWKSWNEKKWCVKRKKERKKERKSKCEKICY